MIALITATTDRDDTDNMEQETLFTTSKWDILTELQGSPQSPVELAKILNTSVANVSQQLRLLEMAGLVQSKRVSNREKGLPRVLYSLSGNHSYMIAAAQEFVDKKLIKLSDRNQVILRIWFLDDPELHYFLEKAFWRFDEHLKDIDGIFLDLGSNEIDFTIISDKDLKIKNFQLTNPDRETKQVKFKFLNEKQLVTASKKKEFYALYNPKGLIKESDDNE